MHELICFNPGSAVWIGEETEQLEGHILELNLDDTKGITYKVAWWRGNDRKCEWLHACEIRLKSDPDASKVRLKLIGFSTPNGNGKSHEGD